MLCLLETCKHRPSALYLCASTPLGSTPSSTCLDPTVPHYKSPLANTVTPPCSFHCSFRHLHRASECCWRGKENHATSLMKLHITCIHDHKLEMGIHPALPRNLTALLPTPSLCSLSTDDLTSFSQTEAIKHKLPHCSSSRPTNLPASMPISSSNPGTWGACSCS